MKILKELIKKDYLMDRKQITLKKELEAIRRSQEELENSFIETRAEEKGMNSRMNNAQ